MSVGGAYKRMNVIIAGSRTITGLVVVRAALREALASWGNPTVGWIGSGGARGVDTVAETVARLIDAPFRCFPADWDKHGRAAGPIRNRQMAEWADAAVLVWDGHSRGTANMKQEMERLGKPVFVYEVKP